MALPEGSPEVTPLPEGNRGEMTLPERSREMMALPGRTGQAFREKKRGLLRRLQVQAAERVRSRR